MDVLCSFKIKIESKNWNMGVTKIMDHIPVMIKISNPSQKASANSKFLNQDFTPLKSR